MCFMSHTVTKYMIMKQTSEDKRSVAADAYGLAAGPRQLNGKADPRQLDCRSALPRGHMALVFTDVELHVADGRVETKAASALGETARLKLKRFKYVSMILDVTC